jgi:methionyl-tRNA formyltransferase
LIPHHSALRLAFAGTPPFAVPALDALTDAGHRVQAVYTQADRPAGRGRSLQESAVKARALALGIPVMQPLSFNSAEAQASLSALGVDAFVVVAYGLILPPAALAIPRLGSFNIHASLLPRWRGAAPIQRAIEAGDRMTGITIMRMDAGLDTGPMLLARPIAIEARDTAATLQDRLAKLGGEAICDALEALQRGLLHEQPQPAQGVCYAAKIRKSEARIDWHTDADTISRKVRAFDPWPVAETHFEGRQVRVWEAESAIGPDTEAAALSAGSIVRASKHGIDVACGRGVLRIARLQLPGGKPIAAHQFASSHALAGARFGDA